jgi:hypothetical protein
MNALCGWSEMFLNVKTGGTHSYHSAIHTIWYVTTVLQERDTFTFKGPSFSCSFLLILIVFVYSGGREISAAYPLGSRVQFPLGAYMFLIKMWHLFFSFRERRQGLIRG